MVKLYILNKFTSREAGRVRIVRESEVGGFIATLKNFSFDTHNILDKINDWLACQCLEWLAGWLFVRFIVYFIIK